MLSALVIGTLTLLRGATEEAGALKRVKSLLGKPVKNIGEIIALAAQSGSASELRIFGEMQHLRRGFSAQLLGRKRENGEDNPAGRQRRLVSNEELRQSGPPERISRERPDPNKVDWAVSCGRPSELVTRKQVWAYRRENAPTHPGLDVNCLRYW